MVAVSQQLWLGCKVRTKLWSRCCEYENTVIDEVNIYTKRKNMTRTEVHHSVVVVNRMTSIIRFYLSLINL